MRSSNLLGVWHGYFRRIDLAASRDVMLSVRCARYDAHGDAAKPHSSLDFIAVGIVNLHGSLDSDLFVKQVVGGRMSMVRGAIGMGLLMLAMGSQTKAASDPGQDQRMSCPEVRYYVEKYTASVAEMYARNQGATDAQIDRARRCLTGNHFRRAERRRTYTD
jgi:hypothetical protein